MSRIEDLVYERTELLTEIARHHRDFQKVRAVLDEYEEIDGMSGGDMTPSELIVRLRSIVG